VAAALATAAVGAVAAVGRHRGGGRRQAVRTQAGRALAVAACGAAKALGAARPGAAGRAPPRRGAAARPRTALRAAEESVAEKEAPAPTAEETAAAAAAKSRRDEAAAEKARILADEDFWKYDLNPDDGWKPADEVGVCAPLGFFDPLGLSKDIDKETFRKYRASELKHGRICMLASVGSVVQHYVRVPGFEYARSSLNSVWDETFKVPGVYYFVVGFLLCGLFDLNYWRQDEDREPGDFGDPFGLGMYDTDMRNRELNNGRFAMFATTGILVAQWYTAKDAVEQLGFA